MTDRPVPSGFDREGNAPPSEIKIFESVAFVARDVPPRCLFCDDQVEHRVVSASPEGWGVVTIHGPDCPTNDDPDLAANLDAWGLGRPS